MLIALLLASGAVIAVLLLRLAHYRHRAKQFQQLAKELAGIGPLDISLLRLGELVPEVGNDRDPAAQAVELVVPYAGWGNTCGLSDTECAMLARLAKRGGLLWVHSDRSEPLASLLEKNAPAGSAIAFGQAPPNAGAPSLILLTVAGTAENLLAASRIALAAIAPGGLILWHGYRPGLTSTVLLDALAELARITPLAHIHGSALLGHRAPRALEAD